MSITSEWTDWHLTPAGWVRGSTKRDGPGFEEKPTPEDRVMTCRWDEENMARVLHTEWKSDDEEAVQELIAKFGPPPEHL